MRCRHAGGWLGGWAGKQAGGRASGWAGGQMDRWAGGRAGGQAGGQVGRWTGGRVGGQSETPILFQECDARNTMKTVLCGRHCIICIRLSKIVTSVVCALWDLVDHDKTET